MALLIVWDHRFGRDLVFGEFGRCTQSKAGLVEEKLEQVVSLAIQSQRHLPVLL